MPDGDLLPEPREVPDTSSTLGNTVLQVVAGVNVLAGLVLLGAWVLFLTGVLSLPGTNTQGLNLALIVVAAIGFLVIGLFLFLMVANARLSDKFRAEEFRNRLRAIGLEDGERPAFLDEIEGLDERDLERLDSGRDPAAAAGTDGDSTDGDGGEGTREEG
jgi:large-conductance mechanosensitive channel